MTRLFLIPALAAALAVAACASAPSQGPVPPAVGPADVGGFYDGRWYEQARRPTRLTAGCIAATTDYVPRSDGRVDVTDACNQDDFDGELRTIAGVGTFRDPGVGARLDVSYRFGPLPIGREYRLIAVDPQGQWFISTDPDFRDLYIFTRQRNPGEAEVTRLIERARSLGYAGELERVAQPQ